MILLDLAHSRRLVEYRATKRRDTLRLLSFRGHVRVTAMPAHERAALLKRFEDSVRKEAECE